MSETNNVYVAYQGNSYLFGGNAPYVEEMYENYLADPTSVPDTWRAYFDALQHVPAVDGSNARDVPHMPVINAFAERAKAGVTQVVVATGADSEMGRKRTAVQQLIAAYRTGRQHPAAPDPLNPPQPYHAPPICPPLSEWGTEGYLRSPTHRNQPQAHKSPQILPVHPISKPRHKC